MKGPKPTTKQEYERVLPVQLKPDTAIEELIKNH